MFKTQGRIRDYKGKHKVHVNTELCPCVKNVPYYNGCYIWPKYCRYSVKHNVINQSFE